MHHFRTMGERKRLRIKGLDYMNDDPSAVDVLYAKVTSADNWLVLYINFEIIAIKI